jgi:hypothetical protein
LPLPSPTSATKSATSGLMQWSKQPRYSITSSAREQRWQDFEAWRLGSLKIDCQLVLGRVLHRQVSRLLAQKNAINIARCICGRPQDTGDR